MFEMFEWPREPRISFEALMNRSRRAILAHSDNPKTTFNSVLGNDERTTFSDNGAVAAVTVSVIDQPPRDRNRRANSEFYPGDSEKNLTKKFRGLPRPPPLPKNIIFAPHLPKETE